MNELQRFCVKELNQTCSACPSQWEGLTADNRRIYVRYRWGYLSVRIGEPDDMAEFAAVGGREVFGEQIGDDFSGHLTTSDMVARTNDVVDWPVDAPQRTSSHD